MKFLSLKENLKKGLSIVSHLSNKNVNLPILNNVLIKVKKDCIEFVTTNLDISIIHSIRAKIEKEGETTVDARMFNEYISLLNDDKLEIELKENSLQLKSDKHKTKLNTQESSDFPLIPEISFNQSIKINILKLKKALNAVVFAASNSDSRAEISSVVLNFVNSKLFIVATDSYKLAEMRLDFESDKKVEDEKVIIPVKTILELLRILNNIKEDQEIEDVSFVDINWNENQISFSFNASILISRLILGNYPDYKQIIPIDSKTIINVKKSNLVKAVKIAGIFSKSGVNDISLSSDDGKLLISSSSSSGGENVSEVDALVEGDNIDLSINYKYLLEGLNNMDGDDLVFSFIDSNSPCKIMSKNNNDYIYIVMPIRN